MADLFTIFEHEIVKYKWAAGKKSYTLIRNHQQGAKFFNSCLKQRLRELSDVENIFTKNNNSLLAYIIFYMNETVNKP